MTDTRFTQLVAASERRDAERRQPLADVAFRTFEQERRWRRSDDRRWLDDADDQLGDAWRSEADE